MLQLEQHEATIRNVNGRIQKHGKIVRRLAGDVDFSCAAPNTILDAIEPGLRESLFRAVAKGEQLDFDHLQKAEAANITDGLVQVRHTGLAPIAVDHDFSGYEITIEDASPDGGAEPIVLVDLTLKNLRMKPLEGGSVVMGFRVSTEITEEECAEIHGAWVRESVRITLTPPSRQSQEQEDLAA